MYSSSSSSSSSGDELDLTVAIQSLQDQARVRRSLLPRIIANNDLMIRHYAGQQDANQNYRGSIPGHRVINRGRVDAHQRLWNDYFSEERLYDDTQFRRRFRMDRDIFQRIVDAVESHDNYFQRRYDALGRAGLSGLQKITAVFRMLAYGAPADSTDEYIKIGESTAIESLKRFCRAVVEIFGEQYLRSPNENDIARLLHIGEQRGFPGMLGSLDCMHWEWKNCPTAWAGQYSGRSGSPTIILEAVADYDLWIWHAYFGLPGSNNDINVLESSNLFANLAAGLTPKAHYVIQGKEYDTGYYLADGIYPKWSTLVQSIQNPLGNKKKLFAMKQESCRKDVERAFGVLQSRWAIIKGPARFWNKRVLHDIMTACIIMHNMVVEKERDMDANINYRAEAVSSDINMVSIENGDFEKFMGRHRQIRDRNAHYALRDALIDHLWDRYGNSYN